MGGPMQTIHGELQSIYKIAETLELMSDAVNPSLAKFASRAAMLHRVYIQSELANEECVYDILVNTQSMIAAWAMCALQMNMKVDDSRTIRKLLDTVATESYDPTRSSISEKFSKKFPGMESIQFPNLILDDAKDKIRDAQQKVGEVADAADKNLASFSPDSGAAVRGKQGGNVEMRLPSGRVLDVSMTTKDGKSQSISIWLQLLPKLIPSIIMEQFIGINFRHSLVQRWLQYTTGEISFLKDFIAEADRRKERLKAIRQDKSGILSEMLDNRANNIATQWVKVAGYRPTRQNIATSILVFDKYSFDKFCKKYNCNFNKLNDRMKFFDSTFAMMVIVVDTMFENTSFYINGIDGTATYSFNQMKSNAKSDKMSMIEIMQALSKNQTPKF